MPVLGLEGGGGGGGEVWGDVLSLTLLCEQEVCRGWGGCLSWGWTSGGGGGVGLGRCVVTYLAV